MLGLIIQIAVSWLLLWWLQKRNLSALGFWPPFTRFFQFLIAFLFTGALCLVIQLVESNLLKASWHLSPDFSYEKLAKAFWWDVKSVLFEEFIFRGALLYIAIDKLGVKWAIIISAACFGIYHWFSFGVFGNPVLMLVIFITTGAMGLVWALSFARTHSMAMPIGFHLGWNFVYNSIFSKGPLGQQMLTMSNPSNVVLTNSQSTLVFLLPNLLVPLLTYVALLLFMRNIWGPQSLEN